MVASIAVGTLIAGSLVTVGVGAQEALAGGPSPTLDVTHPGAPYIAGEDVTVEFNATGSAGSGPQYNLGVAVLLPKSVSVQGQSASLGTPLVFTEGQSMPSRGASCQAVGLTGSGTSCAVPAGFQYLLFQNISDLPEGASNSGTLTLRPEAAKFPVGSTLNIKAVAFTSDKVRFLPSVPGTGGVGDGTETSQPGVKELAIPVAALRIGKSEPSPEGQLLRGAHLNSTTYTLKISHTGEGSIDQTEVVDWLPAGLEYLGMGGIDNSSNANGTQGNALEYPGAATLTGTPAPAGTAANAWTTEKSVSTVVPTAAEVSQYGLTAGKVYTRVAWDLGTLLAAGDARNTAAPVAQNYSGTAGKPGTLEIRYRAAVPLFENTVDFDGAGNQPDAKDGRGQIANLDNNRGASTRHGNELPSADGKPPSLTNIATASGKYAGAVSGEQWRATSATGKHNVQAVDVRVVKTVANASFEQGTLARYSLDLATSEYVSAELGTPPVLPNRVIDSLGDGICPVFPANAAVTPGASTTPGLPNLVIGDLEDGSTIVSDNMSKTAWATALGVLGSSCQMQDRDHAELTGASLTAIAYDPTTGRFDIELAVDPIAAGTGSGPDGGTTGHVVTYTASQNELYGKDSNSPGATSSGDTVTNTVKTTMTTHSVPGLDGVKSAGTGGAAGTPGDKAFGDWRASDDSTATLTASLSELSKSVLPRDAVIPGGDVRQVASTVWESETTKQPFAAGDEIWWKISVKPPTGADVRDAQLIDFLPSGTAFDPSKTGARFDNIAYKVSSEPGLGSCTGVSGQAWLDKFVNPPTYDATGRSLTWALGATGCVPGNSTDRFFPRGATLDVFIKVAVTDVAAFGAVDLTANLAKYQQQNVDGKISFMRDDAKFQLDTGVKLVKGIASVNGLPASGNAWNSNVDNAKVVQKDQVEYRLDVTAPSATTTDYVIYDALPVGIKAADLKGYNATSHEFDASAAIVNAGAPTSTTQFTAKAYDWSSLPASIRGNIAGAYKVPGKERSIVVWELAADVAGSTNADANAVPALAKVERGFTLGYTVNVPDGTNAAGGDAAILSQQFVNTASVAEFSVRNNGGGESTIVPSLSTGNTQAANGGGSGTSVPVSARPVATGEFAAGADLATDPAQVSLPAPRMAKKLVSTEIGPDATAAPAGLYDRDPNNGNAQIAQGELATYDISVTVPANTSVKNGVLVDVGTFVGQSGTGTMTPNTANFKVDTVSLLNAHNNTVTLVNIDEAASPTAFKLNTKTGKLIFPTLYKVGSVDEVFTVRIAVWANAYDASQKATSGGKTADHPDIPHKKILRNTARFDSQDVSGAQNTRLVEVADVQYVQPAPAILKTATPSANVPTGSAVDYKVTVRNTGSALFDPVVIDCVPEGLTNPTGFSDGGTLTGESCRISPTTNNIEVGVGSGQLIKWDLTGSQINVGTPLELAYKATLSASAGGASTYTNRAQVTGYSIPVNLPAGGSNTPAEERRGDRFAAGNRDITVQSANVTKSVDKSSAPVGDTVQYVVTAHFPANANYYDVKFSDLLPRGVCFDQYTNAGVVWAGGPGHPTGPDNDNTVYFPVVTGDCATGQQLMTWNFKFPDGDVLSYDQDRYISVKFTAKITKDIVLATQISPLQNTATLSWNKQNNGAPATPRTATAATTIENPWVTIDKTVKLQGAADATYEAAKSGDPDSGFTYQVRIINASGTPAHNIVVSDVVDPGVKIDPTQAAFNNATFTPNANAIRDGLGGTITWSIAGPLSNMLGAHSLDLIYDATFVASEDLTERASASRVGTGESLNNAVKVHHYESFGAGGWEYEPGNPGPTGKLPGGTSVPTARTSADANVTPTFPRVVPTKTVTNKVAGKNYGVATVGQPFNWTLTVTNIGAGTAENISVTDTLPANWEYAGNAMISINGQAPTALATPPTLTPATVADGQQQQVTWSEAAIRATGATPLLGSDRSFTITFDAKPRLAAATAPGSGIEVPASVHKNSLSVTATDTTGATNDGSGDYVRETSNADAYIAQTDLKLVKSAVGGVIDTGTWVPGKSAQAGVYAQPQWQLTVTNHGPDASVGAFKIVDTPTLPAGVTVTGWAARYFSGAGDTTGTVLSLAGVGTAADPFIVGGTTTSLKADGSDRIVLTANVGIDPTALAQGDDLSNTATVEGTTFEPEDKKGSNATNPNVSTVKKPLEAQADLTIVKTLGTNSQGSINAGGDISWQIKVTNNGPSDSVSTTGNRVTVTDLLPTEVTDLKVNTPLPQGWSSVRAGNILQITLGDGLVLASGASATFTVTGKLVASLGANAVITNFVRVDPGATKDPNPVNNSATVTTAPTTANTTIAANKVRGRILANGSFEAVSPTAPVTAGANIAYRLSVTNTGTADARGASITDTLASYLEVQDWMAEAPGSGWSHSFNAGTRTVAFAPNRALVSGETASVIVILKVASNHHGVVANTACVAADNNVETSQALVCAQTSTASDKVVDLELQKSHVDPDPATPAIEASIAGHNVRYVLDVYNNGPSNSDGPITVTDMLPAGFSYAGGTAATVNGAPVALAPPVEGIDQATGRATATWTIPGPISVASSTAGVPAATIAFDALISSGATAGSYVNDASVAGMLCPTDPASPTCEPEPDSNPSNNRDTDPVVVATQANMTVVKDVVGQKWVAGTDVTYTVTVANSGPSAADSVSLTDGLFDPALTLQSIAPTGGLTAGWTCPATPVPNADSCTFDGRYPVGESTTFTVVATLAAGTLPTDQTDEPLVNLATLAWQDSRDTHSGKDDAVITVSTIADLGLVKTAVDAADDTTEITSAVAGEQARYRIDVHNYGPSNAAGPLTVTDTLPAGLSFIALTSESAQHWSASVDQADPQLVTFTRLPDGSGIAFDETAPALLFDVLLDQALPATAAPDVPGLVNTATAESETPEPDVDPHPNTDDAVIEVSRAIDLAVVKTHDAGVVRIGDELPFSMVVTNHGPSNASGLTLTDTVPAGLEVLSKAGDVADGWTISSVTAGADGTTVVVAGRDSAKQLAVGASAPAFVVNTKVLAAAYPAVTNTVVTKATEPDRDLDNNTATDKVAVPALVTLNTEKTALGEFEVGGTGTFEITVTNTGVTDDPGPITVTDTLPDGLTFVSSPDSGVKVDGQRVVWTLENGLKMGDKAVLTVVVKIGQKAYPQITNYVTVESESELTTESKVSDFASAKVTEPEPGKIIDPGSATNRPGDPLAVTGADYTAFGSLAALMLLLGGAALVLARRRNGQRTQ